MCVVGRKTMKRKEKVGNCDVERGYYTDSMTRICNQQNEISVKFLITLTREFCVVYTFVSDCSHLIHSTSNNRSRSEGKCEIL